MKATKFTPILLALFLGSLIPSMGQQEADTKKQGKVTVITNSQKELEKAMAESIAAEEKALKAKFDYGLMDNKEFLQQAETLKGFKKKLEGLKSTGEDWGPFVTYDQSPRFRVPGDNMEINDAFSMYAGDHENSSLSISKSLEEVTLATDFKYDVKEGASRISFFITGTIKTGEMQIILMKPDKTPFQEIKISPLADVNWNQQFRWDEDESDEYLGTWTISISATKASGNYRVQVNSR